MRAASGKSLYNESYDDPKQKRMESGDGDYSPNSTVSFGYNIRACDVMHIVDVADALGCSIDYLLGRTDRMEVVSDSDTDTSRENVSYSGAGWKTGEPEECGLYLLRLCEDGWTSPMYEPWEWNGAYWRDCTGPHDPLIDGEITGWIPIPEWR